jgi:hypothetical protein
VSGLRLHDCSQNTPPTSVTAVTHGEARVIAATRGVVESAVTAVARGENRVLDSGSCLLDLAVHDLRCAAAALALACAAATFLAAIFSNTKVHAAYIGAVAVLAVGAPLSIDA